MDAASPSTAGDLLPLARKQAGVAQSEIARFESGKPKPNIPTIQRILAGAGPEIRFHLMPLDDHDQVLSAREVRRSPAERARVLARHRRNAVAEAANATPG